MPPERASSLSVAVVCWDLGHNALGRAHLLADMLAADHDVEIVGSHFPEFGSELWHPLRDTGIRVRRYPGGPFPGYFGTMERMAQELTADVVYVVKPRLPGLGVGLLAKVEAGRPLMVDCDDLELSFVGAEHGLSLDEVTGLGDDPDFLRPQGRIWTSFSEWGVRLADSVTVSNVPLAARYGGSIIPHARDERVFDPERYDRDEARARLGLTPEQRVVLFAGTPRRHKGIQQIAAALERIGDPRNRLCVLATRELDDLKAHVAGLEQWVHPVSPEPFSRLPHLLTAADVVCLLQDPASETARWQMPAKVSDALAMGVPCLTTRMPPLLPLIEEGGLVAVTEDDLDAHLECMLTDAAARGEQARRGREIFLRRFSYSAVRPRLEESLRRAASSEDAPSPELLATVAFQRSVFGRPSTRIPTDPRSAEVREVHAAITSAVPPGAGPVAVISRGDDDLVRFENHVGWHFPRTPQGTYTGYYPADSDAAIQHLEQVRQEGARYLAIPASSSWWLDHYPGFRDHVRANYRVIEAGPGISTMVDLTSGSEPRDGERDESVAPQGARPVTRPVTRHSTVVAVVHYVGGEQALDHCLSSLVGQTRPPDGIVVVDDASPVPPVAVLRRFPGVTLLRSAQKVGPDRSIRQVIDDSSSDWYLFQDADGWSAPDRLERLLAAASESGADLVGSDHVTVVTDEGLTIAHALPLVVDSAVASEPTDRPLHHRTSLVRRSLVERLGDASSARWFSGGQDTLRRAVDAGRVVNVPRVLYFERTRPQPSRAPRDVQAQPVALEHLCGPRPDRPPRRLVASRAALRRLAHRLTRERPRPTAPTLVVGAHASGADTVLWSLAQHPSLVPLLDLSWCAPAAEMVGRAADPAVATRAMVSPDRRLLPLDGVGATPDDVRRALSSSLEKVVSDGHGGGSGWVALVPPTPALVRALLFLFPDARLVHVVRDADGTAAALARQSPVVPDPLPPADGYRTWLEGVRGGLECERVAGPGRVLRVRFDELVLRPADVLGECQRFLEVGEDPACARLLEGSDVAAPSLGDTRGALTAGAEARDMSTALFGPAGRRVPSDRALAAPSPPLSATPTPEPDARAATRVETVEPAPLPPLPLPEHVSRAAALLRRTLPAGAVVAVATKGESRFLEIDHVKACHFPQTAWGEWAGYHPADTAEIVVQLRDLRRRGARFLLIPSFASWWLDHYVGLREHLVGTGSVAAESPEAGYLFELGSEPLESVGEPAAEPIVRPRPERRARRARSTGDGFDVVMFWKQHDTGLYGRRHDMLMTHLARSPRVGQVVQFDAPVDLASLRRRDPEVPTHHALLEQLAMARVGGVETIPGLHQHSFVYGGDRRADREFPTRDEYDVYVKDALARRCVGERPVVFWVYPNNFDFPDIARAFGPDLIVADVVDDHRTWLRPGGGEEARILGNYEAIARSADVVLVNCEPMRELMAGMAGNVHLVPNAADYPDPLASAPLQVPDELRSLHGPILGYVGNLSSRIDVELLDRLATQRPDCNLVLVGSAHAGRSIAPLARHPNVTLLGPRPYEEAKRYIRAFDVALIPHLDDPMTRAMNPLKAFVYCSLQVPVVSTDIANLGELRSLVSVASDHDDFIAKVDAAVRAGRTPIGPTADAVLRRNSWNSRTQVITDLLDEALQRKVDE